MAPDSVVALIPVPNTHGLLPAVKIPALSMESPGIASSVAVPQGPALLPVDLLVLFGSDGDVNGLASKPIVGRAVPFIHENHGVQPSREPVAGKMILGHNWSGPTVEAGVLRSNGDYNDTSTNSPNIISSSTVASADSDITDGYPDLVFTNGDDEITNTKYNGQSVTLGDEMCASLFGDDNLTVGAVCSTNGDGDQSSETVSSLFNEVCVDLALFSEELSTLVNEFELDCLEAQSELEGLLALPHAASGEPTGAPGAVVTNIGAGARADALVAAADSSTSPVAGVLSMHIPSLGGEIAPHENSFDFAVAVVTVNGEV